MHTLKIYGHSDDLIEVEGDIQDEYDVGSAGKGYVAISDGTLILCIYEGGMWLLRLITSGGSRITMAANQGPDSDQYSDVMTIESDKPFEWVMCGQGFTSARKHS